MKQMRLMMMAFAMILTAGATAQMRPQRITQEQMTKKMVSELKLDEKQTKKVTKLNKKFKKLIEGEQPDKAKGQRPPMGQGRPGGNHGGGAPGGMGGPGGGGFGGGMGAPDGGFGGGMQGGPRGSMPLGGESQQASYNYDKQQLKYDKKLRKLLSDDQYEGYLKLRPEFHSQRRIREFLWGGEMNMPNFQ